MLSLHPRVHGEKEVCRRVAGAHLEADAWQVGRTRVFLKTGQTAILDHAVLR